MCSAPPSPVMMFPADTGYGLPCWDLFLASTLKDPADRQDDLSIRPPATAREPVRSVGNARVRKKNCTQTVTDSLPLYG